MKKKCLAIVLALATAITCLGGCGKESDPDTGRVDKKVQTTVEPMKSTGDVEPLTIKEITEFGDPAAFSYEMFLRGMNEEENPVLSPISAYIALSMAGAGAKGQTLEEFKKVLGDDFLSVSKNLLETVPTEADKLQIYLANSAWMAERLQPNDQWLGHMEQVFGGEIYRADLTSTETMNNMNRWVKDHTGGMIPQLFKVPLKPEVVLALMNAIYFEGKWETPFAEEDTYDWTFRLENGTTKEVPTMSLYDESFKYFENENGYGLLLPYKDGDYALMAMLPQEGTTVRDMYSKLDMSQISALIDGSSYETVNVKLPKYEIEFEKTLNDTLMDMGLQTAFSSQQADFTGLGTSPDGNIAISKVFQKAVFKLDEEGTKAAAVTVVVMEDNCAVMMDPIKNVYFDRPFLYMIVDTKRDLPLFMGIMDQP